MRPVMRLALIGLAVVAIASFAACDVPIFSSGGTSHAPVVSALPAATATATATPSPLCASWAVTPLPASAGAPRLEAVAAIAANDVWAVGVGAVAIHWDGTAWKSYPTPSLSSQGALSGIAAISTSDVWAVGTMATGQQSTTPLIEHWNGGQWSVVRNPGGTGQQNILMSVAAVASNDVWAVGMTGFNNTQPLILHWNGTSWNRISGPPAPYASQLNGVAAIGHHDVWAVGVSGGSAPHALTEHWNGARWQIVPAPQGPADLSAFNAVAARATNDVWAVGYSLNYPNTTSLTEHWNGARWQVVKSPSPEAKGFNSLLAATIVPRTTTFWAVGEQSPASTSGRPPSEALLIEEWTGKAWTVVQGPAGLGTSSFVGVAATPEGDVWIVGSSGLAMVRAGPTTRASLNCPAA